jgi:sugar/nucleoside kinase (ribokinase family)
LSRVNCLGVLVVDALSAPIGEYPVPKVRTQVNTQTIRFLPGGGAANTAAALGRMGLDAGVFSKVGADLTGEFLVHDLQRVGVDTSGVVMSADETTPFTFVGIHGDGDRTFIHTPGANLTFGVEDIDLEALLSTEMLFYQDFWVKPAIDGAPGAELMAEAQRRGVVTLLDECWGLGPNRETFEMMLPHCDYVMPSLDDMRAIYGAEAKAEEIAARLLDQGVGTVVVKMGAEGCLVAQGDEATHVPALAAEVVDTTGAGDCWDAGFIAGLIEGTELVMAARFGNACAAFCIEAVGGAAGVPSYGEVRARALADARE